MTNAPQHHKTPDIPEALHHRLARTVEVGDVTVDEMAEELGVHRNTVLNYLSGRTRPRRAVLAAWALRTGRSRQWLETGHAPSDPTDVTYWYRDRRGRHPTNVVDIASHTIQAA